MKRQVKDVVKYISNYERALVTQAIHSKVDGVICGHIHHGELTVMDNIIYGNCGDWIESCTAIVEHHTGELELIHWNPPLSKNKK